MVIINIGMPRSGTLWRYKIVRDLVIAGGGTDGLEIRRKFLLSPFIDLPNADLNTTKMKRLLPASIPSFLGQSYVLNTHAKPSDFAASMLKSGRLKAIYGYRDPRDCILSILEYAKRSHSNSSTGFVNIKNVEQAVEFMQLYIRVWKAWTSLDGVFVLRYEDLLTDYQSIVDRIIDYLEIKITDEQRQQIANTYLPRKKPEEGVRIHFSHGKAARFREKFTEEEQAFLYESYRDVLEDMGYPE